MALAMVMLRGLGASVTRNFYCWRNRRRREVSAVTGSSGLQLRRGFKAGTILANNPGKIRRVIDGARHRIDIRLLHQLRERQLAGKIAVPVKDFRAPAIEQDPPIVQRTASWEMAGGGHLGEDVGRAIVGRGVVPLRMVAKFIGLLYILQKKLARPVRAGCGVEEVDVFAGAVIRAQADDVAFVGKNI